MLKWVKVYPRPRGKFGRLRKACCREKAITRLVELTTEPEIESDEEDESVETPVESSKQKKFVDEVEAGDAQEAGEDSQPVRSDDKTEEVEEASDAKIRQTGSEIE